MSFTLQILGIGREQVITVATDSGWIEYVGSATDPVSHALLLDVPIPLWKNKELTRYKKGTVEDVYRVFEQLKRLLKDHGYSEIEMDPESVKKLNDGRAVAELQERMRWAIKWGATIE